MRGGRMGYEIRAMSFGEILDAGFRIVRDHAAVLVGISALMHVPMALLAPGSPFAVTARPAVVGAELTRVGIVMALALLGGPIVTTATTWAVGELYVGRPASLEPALRAAGRILLPLSGTVLLLYLVVGLVCGLIAGVGAGLMILVHRPAGLFLLVLALPAAVFYAFLSFLLLWPVMVLERSFGRRALGRSRALMRGNLLRGLGITIVGAAIVSVLGGVLQIALGYIPVLGPLGVGLARSAGGAYTSTVLVLLYFDIRCRKEAFDLEHLAELVARQAPVAPALA